jgi:hypothetical protein
MPSINLATKYSGKLDQLFTAGSYTDAYINKDYDFTGAKTVEVYTVSTVELSNYDRTNTGDRFGGNNEIQDVVTAYTIGNDKCFKLTIDEGNYQQQALAKKAGEVLKAQMEEKVIPTIDKNRLLKAAIGAAAVSQYYSPTANDAYGDVLKMSAALDEAKAPQSGRVLWVTPAFYNGIKSQITTNVEASGYNDKLLGRGFVGELDGCPVVKVPTSYMPTNTSAIMIHRDALLGAKQIMNTRIITDSELVDGTILLGRFIFDSFVLNGKKKAVAAIGTGSLS